MFSSKINSSLTFPKSPKIIFSYIILIIVQYLIFQIFRSKINYFDNSQTTQSSPEIDALKALVDSLLDIGGKSATDAIKLSMSTTSGVHDQIAKLTKDIETTLKADLDGILNIVSF